MHVDLNLSNGSVLIMKRMITYHSCKSTSIGGVESLIRELQKLAVKEGYSCIELFRDEGNKDTFDPSRDVAYQSVCPMRSSKLKIIVSSWWFFLKKITGKDDLILIFNPVTLFLIPFWTVMRSRVFLVQASRLDVVYSSFFSKLVVRVLSRFVNGFTFYSDSDLCEFYRIFKIPKEKLLVIPRGCRLPLADNKDYCGRRIVSVCRIDEASKNLSAMIEIMKILGSSFFLDVYGDGREVEVQNFKKKILGVDNIRYMGVARDVAQVLAKYSIFIMTSKYEGLGQAAIEAQSQGLPVVMFDTFPNAKNVILDKKTGYLVEPWNYSCFCNSLRNITSNIAVFESMSESAICFSRKRDIGAINDIWLKEVF